MQRQRSGFLIFLICLASVSHALDLSRINLGFQYDLDAGMTISHRVVETEEGVVVYFRVSTDTLNLWQSHFLLQEKYNSPKHDTLSNYTLDTLQISLSTGYFKLIMPQSQKALLLISMVDLDRGLYRIGDVRISTPVGFTPNLPMDAQGLPVFESYVTGERVRIAGETSSLHAYQYQDDFGSADPPMGLMKPIAPSLTIDSSFYFERELVSMEDYHFYLIQEDTLAQTALTLLKCPAYYPEFKRLDELIGPLTYITTPTELKAISDSQSKKVFENFWINTYGTKFRAKNAIRVFYGQVENANRLFTDYKQGWKTDRGMIYIIFGRPDQVFRNESTEVWKYNDGPEFEFIRISTLFTPTMYTLKRDRQYERLWYSQVGDLRKGL
ncbi:MAG: GWxTD domain-containing protein [Marinoscillum sp.]|uniref:GWxTD domain-containing protein n=1 Tax=Marinoscillum sp. TaxID=2024838 RepID=UPI0032F931AF